MGVRGPGLLLAAVLVVAGCGQVDSAVDEASAIKDKGTVCAEALGLVDLQPLVDPDRLQARAEAKRRRLLELAEHVTDQDVKNSLLTVADSYVEVQQERFEDLSVVASWATRNAENIDELRKACT